MRRLALNVAGVTFRRQAALGLVRMRAEHGMEVRLTPEPDNTYDRNAVKVEMRPAGLPPEAPQDYYHVGYVPREYTPLVSGVIARGQLRAVRVLASGTLVKDDTTPWWRIAVEYEVPTKRKSAPSKSP